MSERMLRLAVLLPVYQYFTSTFTSESVNGHCQLQELSRGNVSTGKYAEMISQVRRRDSCLLAPNESGRLDLGCGIKTKTRA